MNAEGHVYRSCAISYEPFSDQIGCWKVKVGVGVKVSFDREA